MEPISYMIGMFNFTCGFGWYYMFITKPNSQTATEWMEVAIRRRILAKYGVTDQDFQLLKQEIEFI